VPARHVGETVMVHETATHFEIFQAGESIGGTRRPDDMPW
jgi:hypothetical protein